jgi:hypothetical protein
MKRLLIAALAAAGLGLAAQSARADCAFDYSCCRHFSFVKTCKQRCLTYTSCCNPLPCLPSCGPSCGPALWDSLAAYGYGAYGYAAPHVAAVAPAAAAPTATTPSFNAPKPTPAPKTSTGLQQAGYFYYPPTTAGYNYNYGYGAGYGYGYGYTQAPSYWYDN